MNKIAIIVTAIAAILVASMSLLVGLGGIGLQSVLGDGYIESTFITIPNEEIIKNGNLEVEYVVQFKPEEDDRMYCLIESYDGDEILKAYISEIGLDDRMLEKVYNDNYIMQGVVEGQHTLTYKIFCSHPDGPLSSSRRGRVATPYDDGTLFYVKDYSQKRFFEALPAKAQNDFFKNGKKEVYYSVSELITNFANLPYDQEDSHRFCIEYCSKSDVQIIKEVVYVDRVEYKEVGCQNDTFCQELDPESTCSNQVCVKEVRESVVEYQHIGCESDDDCSEWDGECVHNDEGFGYCYKEDLVEQPIIQHENNTIYETTRCSEIDCGTGYDCRQEQDKAYCIPESTESGLATYYTTIIFIVIFLSLIGMLVMIGLYSAYKYWRK